MAKILSASCDATGKVTAEGVIVDNATVINLGKKASTGMLLMDGDKSYYITANATDIQKVITDMVAILDALIAALTAIDGVTTTPGSAAALIANITALKVTFNTTKDVLK